MSKSFTPRSDPSPLFVRNAIAIGITFMLLGCGGNSESTTSGSDDATASGAKMYLEKVVAEVLARQHALFEQEMEIKQTFPRKKTPYQILSQ